MEGRIRTPRYRHWWRTIGAVLFVVACAAQPAAARTDYSDLWWNPSESGWGVNFVQAQNFLFASFFLYGPASDPTWYTAEMNLSPNGSFSGPLYTTTGAYFAGTANQAHKSVRQVGEVSFTPTTATSGTLVYTVDGIAVSKNVERQTLQTIPLGESYIGGLVTDISGCTNPSVNMRARQNMRMRVMQVAADHKLTVDLTLDGGTACKFTGIYEQRGQLYSLPSATYFCSDGLSATARISELRATARGIEGKWTAPLGAGCTETGEFSAVLAL